MAELKEDILEWLQELPDNALVGIGDGGLDLQLVNGEVYFEIGGIPEDAE